MPAALSFRGVSCSKSFHLRWLLPALYGSEDEQGRQEGRRHTALQSASNGAWEDPAGCHTKCERTSAGSLANELQGFFPYVMNIVRYWNPVTVWLQKVSQSKKVTTLARYSWNGRQMSWQIQSRFNFNLTGVCYFPFLKRGLEGKGCLFCSV